MITINVNNSKCKVQCTLEELRFLRSKLRIRVPGAFFSDAFRRRVWDGFSYYITESGYISTGLLPKLCKLLDDKNWEYELEDKRVFEINKLKLPKKLGKLTLRDNQLESAKSVINSYHQGLYFPRGVLDEATNFGKSLTAAALFKAYPSNMKMILIVNRKHIHDQLVQEITELVGNEVGYISGKEIKWNRLMIFMAQTLRNNLHRLRDQLSQFDICVVDECHYASSPTYKEILQVLDNSTVRVGMSGSPFEHKDKNKNERILSFFGPTLHETTNDDLIKLGFSTKPIVTICTGNTLVKLPGEYKEEETKGLIKSKERNGKVLKRVKHHYKKKRLPMLVICKFHNHTELIYKKVKKQFPELRVNYIHVKVKDRMKILKDFKEGRLDILVSSKLIKEGQNLPLIKSLIIAAGGDSVIDVLQIVGRSLRKHESKSVVYIDDFKDDGAYLKRHSKHRIAVYKAEKFKILDRTIN